MIFIDNFDRLKKELDLAKANEIIKRIKKQPICGLSVKPSELESAVHIEKVELAEDKTVRMYIKGEKEPIRMYPEIRSVWFISYYKRIIPLIIHSLTKEMGLIGKIVTLLAIKFNFHIIPRWFEHIFYTYEATLKDENYSQPVKEVRRVLKGKLDQNLIDALALILEYDSAYRWRFQDIIVELNKDNLNKPAKEIVRLFDIIFHRAGCGDPKWLEMKKMTKLLFLFSPKIKKQVVAILKDINIDEVRFSKEDIYWTNKNRTYNYRGMTLKDREEENKKNYGE